MNIFDIEKGTKLQRLIAVPGFDARLPVTVVRGPEDGPNVLITAGIHNEEYTGIETANRLAAELRAEDIRGCVTIVHVCNPTGFVSLARDVVPEDGENLNRCFPGSSDSGPTHRLAHFLTEDFIKPADIHLDLHCGGGREQLTPHVYYPAVGERELTDASKKLAALADMDYMVAAAELSGSAFTHASLCGVPSVLLERGCMAVWTETEVAAYLEDVRRVLCRVGVLPLCTPQTTVPRDILEVDNTVCAAPGCWYPAREAGDTVTAGEVLGKIKDNFGKVLFEARAKRDSVILFQLGSFSAKSGEILISCGVL